MPYKAKLPLCDRVLMRRLGGPESMSERPRALLFSAKPDDVFLAQPLFVGRSNSATHHMVSERGNYTCDETYCSRSALKCCFILRLFLCYTGHHKYLSKCFFNR